MVQDGGVFEQGSFYPAGKIQVASLGTILNMKAATLVSRCSEKDLFDLCWLFEAFPALQFSELIERGFKIDKGVNAENVLSSIAGAILKEESCDFAIDRNRSKKEIYRQIKKFQKQLKAVVISYLNAQPTPELGKFVRQARKVLK